MLNVIHVSDLKGDTKTSYPRNEKLDQKISVYRGDITKLEIDAIVNAGMWVHMTDVYLLSEPRRKDSSSNVFINYLFKHMMK